MRSALRILALLSLPLALTGCGEQALAPGAVKSAMARLLPGQSTAARTRDSLTPGVIAKLTKPLLYVDLPQRGTDAALIYLGQNRDVHSWTTPDGVSLSLRNGIVTATRGLGGDLMSADLAQLLPALRQGHGRALRVHRYLDGQNHMVTRAFVCDLTSAGRTTAATLSGPRHARLVVENCTDSSGVTFENRYWLGADNRPLLSHQWLGPQIGTAQIQPLGPQS